MNNILKKHVRYAGQRLLMHLFKSMPLAFLDDGGRLRETPCNYDDTGRNIHLIVYICVVRAWFSQFVHRFGVFLGQKLIWFFGWGQTWILWVGRAAVDFVFLGLSCRPPRDIVGISGLAQNSRKKRLGVVPD